MKETKEYITFNLQELIVIVAMVILVIVGILIATNRMTTTSRAEDYCNSVYKGELFIFNCSNDYSYTTCNNIETKVFVCKTKEGYMKNINEEVENLTRLPSVMN